MLSALLAQCFNDLVVELQGIISEVNRGAADRVSDELKTMSTATSPS